MIIVYIIIIVTKILVYIIVLLSRTSTKPWRPRPPGTHIGARQELGEGSCTIGVHLGVLKSRYHSLHIIVGCHRYIAHYYIEQYIIYNYICTYNYIYRYCMILHLISFNHEYTVVHCALHILQRTKLCEGKYQQWVDR